MQKKPLLLCDNLNVVRRVQQLQKGYQLPPWAPGIWKAILFHCQHHDIAWVPAHGKHASWTPCRPGHTADMWRLLNRFADERAQKLTDLCTQEIQHWKADFDPKQLFSDNLLLSRVCSATGFGLNVLLYDWPPGLDVFFVHHCSFVLKDRFGISRCLVDIIYGEL